jgi:molybdenum-dependent DNA-binding transcriptional regulator ModE
LETAQAHGGANATSDPGVDPALFRALQSQVSQLLATVGKQGLELTQLQGRVGQVQVEIQGVVFQSVLDVEKFIFNDYKEYSKGLFFDAVSLLQIVHGNMGKSGEEIIESEYHAKRSNYSSDLDAKYSASFKSVVLPTIFGAASAGVTHACALPAVKTFSAFDPQDGLSDGEKQKILNGIENQVGSLVSAFENIYPAGSKLAAISNQLLGDSVLFIKNMLTFMTEFYTEMCRTSASGEAGNWGLTCQIINRLFKDLSVQRRSGGEARSIEEPVARGAKYLWLTLQTHRVMQEYTKTKFREHPSIAPMLNISLFKTMVTIEKFDTLREACKKMEVTVQAAKLLADKALSAANAGKGQGKRELKP